MLIFVKKKLGLKLMR